MVDKNTHTNYLNDSSDEHRDILNLLKNNAEQPLNPDDNSDSAKKRATLRLMFLGYIIISAIFIFGIAYAIYKSFGSDSTQIPTPINTIISSSIITDTKTPIPSVTSTPLPLETFTPQPVSTSTLAPYPIYMESPYPIGIDNTPYPLTTDIPIIAEPPTVTLSISTDEPSAITETEISQLVTSPTATIIYFPTKTPTKIKHPCPCSHDIYDCKDFTTHALAQACYDYCVLTGWGDAHHLDKGGSGIVCRGLP